MHHDDARGLLNVGREQPRVDGYGEVRFAFSCDKIRDCHILRYPSAVHMETIDVTLHLSSAAPVRNVHLRRDIDSLLYRNHALSYGDAVVDRWFRRVRPGLIQARGGVCRNAHEL